MKDRGKARGGAKKGDLRAREASKQEAGGTSVAELGFIPFAFTPLIFLSVLGAWAVKLEAQAPINAIPKDNCAKLCIAVFSAMA